MKKRFICVVLAAILLFCCGGCSLDVDSFLKPPLAQGVQQQVQTALETYIRDSGRSTTRYNLQYPSEGQHTSAFVVCDEAGQPVAENGGEPAMAVAFYSFTGAKEEAHINLLRRSGEEWVSLGDVTGFGTEILQVGFGDLDGDGLAELVAGFSTYSSRDHRLVLFSLSGGLTVLDTEQLYTQLYIGDLRGQEQDGLLLLRIGAANEVSAELYALEESRLSSIGKTPLDGYIQQFGDMTLCALDSRVNGLYVDAVKNGGAMITELIYYDGSTLQAPFYDPKTKETTATLRAMKLAARDIDGDGELDVPTGTLLPGYTPEQNLPSYAWLTQWRSWDNRLKRWREPLYTVVNTADGYVVTLDEEQWENMTTTYDSTTRTLSFLDTEKDVPWLRLRAEKSEEPGYFLLYEGSDAGTVCSAWIAPAYLDKQKAQYMVSRLPR